MVTKRKNPSEKKKPGRKPLFKPEIHPKIVLSLARRGFTFEEIAPKLGIVTRTLTEWRKKYPEIDQALSTGHAYSIATLEASAFKRGNGLTTREKKIIQVPDGVDENQKPKYKIQRVEIIEKEYPPDPAAINLCLQAWDRGTYGNALKLTGDKENPVEVKHDISPEAADLIKQLYRTGAIL